MLLSVSNAMKDMLNRKYIVRAVMLLWVLFSLGYIMRDQWLRFRTVQLQSAYKQGFADSVQKLITESGKCEPISVYNADEKVSLINIECLKPTDETTEPK